MRKTEKQRPFTKITTLKAALAGLAIATAPVALSHWKDGEPMQSFRQSYWTIVAMNFGPLGDMVKGKMEWDQDKAVMWAEDVAAMASIDVTRAFGPGTDKGMTRAKPAIWENKDDFVEKYQAFTASTEQLVAAAKSGDKGALAEAVKNTGGKCKACHDEYKAKDYLY
jgi:cytochrome c556